MNIDTEVEKLNIDERKIIHILLKNLMYIKNELAYVKNNAELNSTFMQIAENKEYDKSSFMPVVENKDGDKPSFMPVTENKDGDKFSFMALSENKEGDKNEFWLYTAFEQELKKALELYIKNGNGQNSLYSFYADFVDAVHQKNKAAMKIKEAEKNLTLEDTHILPRQLTVDDNSIDELASTLRVHLPRTAPWNFAETVAREFLNLYNIGKATTTQLRGFAGLSASGISKHLLKLQHADFIKKQPPSNYVLTEKSLHILLENFGIAKN